MRIVGLLVGSAIAVALLILLVGVPELNTSNRTVNAVSDPEAEPAPAPPPEEPPPIPLEATQLEATQEAEYVEPPIESSPPVAVAASPATIEEQDLQTPVDANSASTAEELRWYAFWSPFRSRIAANGFVTQLQRVTGLDYRVVNVKPGVYEVAFAYADDSEIQANLSQISAATGLDVPES